MRSILVVSDHPKEIISILRSIRWGADNKDPRQRNITIGTDLVTPSQYDIAFLDLERDDWQKWLIELRSRMPVIGFADANVHLAVEAMKLGASDFVAKPLEADTLREIVKRHKKKVLENAYGFDETVGTSLVMQEVFGLIKKAAASESNVLITGESGTGKELVARAIHRWSPRKDKPFVVINCSAIPDTLLESELFGFEKGAFTGANYTKKGLIEMADQGTVFFDEIGDVTPLFQTKILRVIQEGEILRIGGTQPITIDVRFIAATNKDLGNATIKGSFRDDLYYRLNVINIDLPPLRNRMEDIPALIEHFIKKHALKRKDLLVKSISEEAANILKQYSFPGNIRELENIIERAISFTNSPTILPSDLPANLLQAPSRKVVRKMRLKAALADLEKELIWSALQRSGGNVSKAAAELGIYRQQLQRKLKRINSNI